MGGRRCQHEGRVLPKEHIICRRAARGQGGQAQTHRRALLQMNLETPTSWSCPAKGMLEATAVPHPPSSWSRLRSPGEAGIFSDAM